MPLYVLQCIPFPVLEGLEKGGGQSCYLFKLAGKMCHAAVMHFPGNFRQV